MSKLQEILDYYPHHKEEWINMTREELRDHFAGLAMQKLFDWEDNRDASYNRTAKVAYTMADAMLAERESRAEKENKRIVDLALEGSDE